MARSAARKGAWGNGLPRHARTRAAQFTVMDGAGEVLPIRYGDALDYHPLCLVFPPLPGDEQDALNADVKENGVREAGWLYEGKILEGRHRFIAAKAAGKPMLFRQYVGKNAVAFVISANMRRRHMDATARAMAVAKLEQLGHGGARRGSLRKVLTRGELAAIMHVSQRSATDARVVTDKGAPELIDATARSVVPVKVAAVIAANVPIEEQGELVARGEKEIIAAAKVIRKGRNDARRAEKVERTIAINKGNKPLTFGEDGKRAVVISADPPWRYENPIIGDCDKSIENKYPTMSLGEICAMPVHEIAADAAVIGLHIPQPLALCIGAENLCYPHQVGRAWGDPRWNDPKKCDPRKWFVPRTQFIWEKRSPADILKDGGPIGMGHYGRTDHECFVIMTRGGLALPAWKPRSVFHVRSRGELEHSEKPAEIYASFARMYAEYCDAGLAIALFERKARPGFVVWGNQAPEAKAA